MSIVKTESKTIMLKELLSSLFMPSEQQSKRTGKKRTKFADYECLNLTANAIVKE